MKKLFIKKIIVLIVLFAVCVNATYSYATVIWDAGNAKKIDSGMTLPSKNQNGGKKSTPVKPSGNQNTKTKNGKKEQPKTSSSNKNVSKNTAKKEIDYAIEHGYAYTNQSGEFLPEKSIQRYELIYMVNRAFGFKKQKDINFTDVKKSDAYYKDVSITMGAGYLYTFKNNTVFGPDKYFYRWELPYLLGKAMNIDFSKKSSKTLMKYSDGATVPKKARASVSFFIEKGWMKPNSNKKFGSDDILKKGEVAYVLYQLHKAGYLK